MDSCPACGNALASGLRSWHRVCAACGYEGSTLDSHILDQAQGGSLDEPARKDALESLRRSNFRRLTFTVDRYTSGLSTDDRPLRLLDVGCAHGWFIEQTRERYQTTGIEPDNGVATETAAKGIPVREGFFPEVLDAKERFDIIVFNDVLEHIPDINATLEACRHHLSPSGLLVINAPNRNGMLYRISKLLLKMGRPEAFQRLWQLGFPSPHVHYLDSNSVAKLARRHGFEVIKSQNLPSVSASGLYSRIRYSKNASVLNASLMTVAVTCAIPALAVLPPDIKVWFLRRDKSDQTSASCSPGSV